MWRQKSGCQSNAVEWRVRTPGHGCVTEQKPLQRRGSPPASLVSGRTREFGGFSRVRMHLLTRRLLSAGLGRPDSRTQQVPAVPGKASRGPWDRHSPSAGRVLPPRVMSELRAVPWVSCPPCFPKTAGSARPGVPACEPRPGPSCTVSRGGCPRGQVRLGGLGLAVAGGGVGAPTLSGARSAPETLPLSSLSSLPVLFGP